MFLHPLNCDFVACNNELVALLKIKQSIYTPIRLTKLCPYNLVITPDK